MSRDLVAGIDSSTQSCMVVVRRLEDGAVVGESRAPHPPTTPPRSEQDPRDWWTALALALGGLADLLPRVAAISVGGQGHGLVLLDGDDAPLRPAKLWNDTESAPDAERLRHAIAPAEWARWTGSVPGPAMTVSKLAWTERRHPGLVGEARRVMLPFDYIVYRLSGRAVTERGGASGTGYFDPVRNGWAERFAASAVPGIDWSGRLPSVIGSDEPAGTVVERAALGALTGAVVGAGTGDNMAAALGLDVREGDTVVSLGTSGTIYAVCRQPVRDVTGAINGFADATGRFMPMVTTLNAAKVTDTLRRLLGVSTDDFDDLAISAPAGSGGVVLVPYLDGERTPDRPDATGSILGLRTDATPALLARAALEGVLCGLLDGGDLLAREGVGSDGRLILTGGAARSRSYRQVLADLTGRTVWTSPLVEAAAGGAAVQAAAALTGRPSATIAAEWAMPLVPAAEPDPKRRDRAADVRQAYTAAIADREGDRHGNAR